MTTEFVSHSASRRSLEYLFTCLLPSLRGKRLLDVGSRLGAVLYGAHLFSEAEEVVGVEVNREFCQMTQEAIKRYSRRLDRPTNIGMCTLTLGGDTRGSLRWGRHLGCYKVFISLIRHLEQPITKFTLAILVGWQLS